MSDELKVAIEAAKLGAKKALSFYNSTLSVKYKSDKTPVTIADKETEKVIINYVKSHFPEAKFLGEETGGDIIEKDLWIVDPIDGTRSFIRGLPAWCTLIALSRNKRVILSVAYFPVINSMYYAQKNKGAFVNGKRIYVSKVKDLEKSYLGYGSIKYFKNKQALIGLMSDVGCARSWESTYFNCLVAEGKMEINLDAYAKVWDLAPFKLLIEEAGGKITRLNGQEWTLQGCGGAMTNGILHEEVIKILNKK